MQRGAADVKLFRMHRLFRGRSGRCLDVAVDHGFFNEAKFLEGIEDIRSAVQALAEAGPDAIQLTLGQAGHLQSLPGRNKPALVLRTDVANVYGRELPGAAFSHLIAHPVEQALRLDAVCVVVNVFSIPGLPDLHGQCIRNVLALQPECERFGMPLMVEPLVFAPNRKDGGYMPDGDPEKIIPLVRQAAELGADIIKADPTADPEAYHRVIEVAGKVPVLVRGGGRAPDAEILARTEVLIRQGAAGIVYGRNIIQHPNPKGMVRALMALVHDGASRAEAEGLIRANAAPQRVQSGA
jgi:class I fructose-bisphosphate aldolase